MDDDTPNDIFEPFDLEGGPPRPEEPEKATRRITNDAPQTATDMPTAVEVVACASCGAHNPTFNRHCEACGARLSQAPMPIAPQPMLRTTAGARALMVLAGVILGVALLAGAVNVFRGDGETTAESTTTSTTTTPQLNITELHAVRTECNSELASFPCKSLTDDDPANSWNATDGGIGAELTFLFSPPVQITEIFLHNLEDEDRFLRNARIKGIEVEIDDLPQDTVTELDDTSEPQKVQIRSLRTSRLVIRITSAYPGQSVGGKEPFRELALQEITFFGRVSPEASG